MVHLPTASLCLIEYVAIGLSNIQDVLYVLTNELGLLLSTHMIRLIGTLTGD
jgi:hypothetical protein